MNKKSLETIVAALLPLLAIACADVQARPSKEVSVTYYRNASLKVKVGRQLLPCNGGLMTWGKRTKFFTRTESACENTRLPSPTPLSCHFTQPGCNPLGEGE